MAVSFAGRIRQRVGSMRYNAKRCEASRHDQCRCRCGGKLHGRPHTERWMKAQAKSIAREEYKRASQMPLPLWKDKPDDHHHHP